MPESTKPRDVAPTFKCVGCSRVRSVAGRRLRLFHGARAYLCAECLKARVNA